MTERIQLGGALPEAQETLLELHKIVEAAAERARLDKTLVELVKIRASQLNGCAFCLDMHTGQARAHGVSERKIFMLSAWKEAGLYSEQERAALELTEAMTALSTNHAVSDEVYVRATEVFTEEQYAAVAWVATVINTFNRLGVTSRPRLPNQR